MIITALRFLGNFKPGDIIPADYFDADLLAKNEAAGRLAIERPKPQPRKPRKAAKRKPKNEV